MIAIPDNAGTVVAQLERYGYEAYVVGGCVRDSLLGRQPKDWDVCTNALPEEVLRVFRRFHVIKTGLKHGTVTVMVNHQPIEVTTYRIDGEYTDNRHPDAVQFVSQIEADLARRDFTINAMAFNPTHGLVDVYGGQNDLVARQVRCVGEPDARFHEDGLRLLRALRFAARYRFDIERETAYAIHRNRHLLENVSVERILSELKGILVGDGVLEMMQAFPDVFAVIIPELADSMGFEQHNPHHSYDVWTHTAHAVQAAPATPLLRLTMLLHDIAKPACFALDATGKGHFPKHPLRGAKMARLILERMHCDNATIAAVSTLVAEHDNAFPTTIPGMRRLIGRIGEPAIRHLFDIKKADIAAQSAHERPQKRAALSQAALLLDETLEAGTLFTLKDLAINGRELMQLGVPQGPDIKRILTQLLHDVQDNAIPNTYEALASRVSDYC